MERNDYELTRPVVHTTAEVRNVGLKDSAAVVIVFFIHWTPGEREKLFVKK